jgi:hypothetical protein
MQAQLVGSYAVAREGLRKQGVRLRDWVFPVALTAQGLIFHRWTLVSLLSIGFVPSLAAYGVAREFWRRWKG